MDRAKVNSELELERIVLEVTLVMDSDTLNANWAPNHRRKHWGGGRGGGRGWWCWR
jgi:hypothetical protein